MDNTFLSNTSDFEKINYILEKDENGEYKRNEQERLDSIEFLKSTSYICKVAMTLSEEKRLDDRITSKISAWDLIRLIKELNNIELVKKSLSYMQDIRKPDVINQDKFDSKTKLDLIKYIDNQSYRMDIIKTITEENLLEESLKYFDKDSLKAQIINRISNETTKIRLGKSLQEEQERFNVFKTLDANSQINYLSEFNLTDSHKAEIIMTCDEDKQIELLDFIDNSTYILKIAMNLSEEKRTNEKILNKLSTWDLTRLIKELNNIELVKKSLSYMQDIRKPDVINQDKFDSKTKLDLVKYINEQSNRISVIDKIEENDLLEESLKYFQKDTYKRQIISRITDVNKRMTLAKTLEDENERYEIFKNLDKNVQISNIGEFNLTDSHKAEIIMTCDEDKQIELLDFIDNSTYILKIAMNLSEEKRINEKILNKLSTWDLTRLIKELNNIELVKKSLSYMQDIRKPDVINQDKFDSKTKLDLVKYISEQSNRISVIEKIEENDLLEESLKYFQKDTYKRQIISRITDVGKRITLAKTLEDENERYEIFKNLDKNVQISNIGEFNLTDSHKIEILMKYTEEERIDLLKYINASSYLLKIALTLSEEKRVKDEIISRLDIYNKISLIESLNNVKLVEKCLPYIEDDYKKASIISSNKFDSKNKINLLKYLNNQSSRKQIIDSISEDDLLEESLSYITKDDYKAEIICRIKEKARRIKLASSVLENITDIRTIKYFIGKSNQNDQDNLYLRLNEMLSNENRLTTIRDNRIFIEEFKKISELGSRYRILVTSPFIYDEVKIHYVKEFQDEKLRVKVLAKIQNDDLRIKAYEKSPLTEENVKMEYLRTFSDANKKKQLNVLDNNVDKLIIINEIKDKKICAETLQVMENYKEVLIELFNDKNYKLISNFNDDILSSVFDSKQIKILHEYNKFTRDSIKEHFGEYVHNHYEQLNNEDISTIAKLIFNIDTSNSEEIGKQADSFLESILSSDNPLEKFEKVEKIFIQNHLPYFAKAYLTFLTVHPDFESYDFKNSRKGSHPVTSPVLNEASLLHKKTLILMDIIKCSLGSDNINFQEYLNKLEFGNQLYLTYKENPNLELNEENLKILEEFRDNRRA